MTGVRSPLKKDLDHIAIRVGLGVSLESVASEYGVARATVRDYLRRSGFRVPFPRVPPPHGSMARYWQGCRCADCRGANTEQAKRGRLARWGKTPPTHGASAYSNWGCRCEVCSSDHSARMRLKYQRRRERAGLSAGSADDTREEQP